MLGGNISTKEVKKLKIEGKKSITEPITLFTEFKIVFTKSKNCVILPPHK